MTTPTTRSRSVRRLALGATAGVALVFAAPLAASAHVGVTPDTTAAGSYANLTFAVPHGCDGSSTTEVRITIPEDVITVTPTVNPNWDVVEVPSETDPDYTSAVVYTAKTPLADGLRDTFTLSVPLPDGAAGDVLAFPVLQTCEVGSTSWDEETVEGEDEPEHPAPVITLTEASDDAHGHGASDTEDAAGSDASGAGESGGTASPTSDPATGTAIGLGVAGLVVGLAGVVLALWALRRRNS
ncbi:DUF1775 domain-containing protein [Labedella phragmitis]|uniref:DUF1775 domain-containing protein n=1 Tax=Labedella phragmitis TaxID=2498849 RepID=A0A444PSU9_9MICO|nr:YcnI family protein [Labedella phragmitis]RWZ50951.1 DUF1775 domain-containing protein [Labedella phragmitis]